MAEQEKELELLDLLKVIISGNQKLDNETFKRMIEAVGENYDSINNTSTKVSLTERRKRMQDNFYGTILQMMLQISQLVVAQNEELTHLRVMIESICDKLDIENEKRLTEQDKLAIEQTKYMKLLNEAGQIKLQKLKEDKE